MAENESQKKLMITAVSYVLIFALGGASGYLLASNGKTTTSTQIGQDRQFGAGGFGGAGTGTRRPGMGGRFGGEVTAVNGNTITVKNTNGDTETINVTDATTYKQSSATTKDKVTVGSTISITPDFNNNTGSAPGSTTVNASAVTIN